MTTHNDRWTTAQEYEREHWNEIAARVARGQSDLRWYDWKARRTLGRFEACRLSVTSDATVVEIGSGPVGQVGFLPGRTKIAVDPLIYYFEQHAELISFRPRATHYVCAKGEALPLPDGTSDLVIIDNCLDHCESPRQVLVEIRRILKPRGHLYLTLNLRLPVGSFIRRAIESAMPLDKGHPHSYHKSTLEALIGATGFERQRHWLQPWEESAHEEWERNKTRAAMKIGTLTLERLYESIWVKT